jgi:hypothetical protein
MIASIQFVVAVAGAGPVLVAGAAVGVVAVVAVGVVGVVEVVVVVVGSGTEVLGACVFGAEGVGRCTLGCEATVCTCGVLATALTALTL